MAEGRGSAVVAMAVLCLLAVACKVAEATSFTVGDANGWSMSIAGWEKGKTFKAGDTLVFNYAKGSHNVVAVNKAGYDGCTQAPSDKVYISGKDQVTLVKGLNYFICTIPGHCSKMKIQINAS